MLSDKKNANYKPGLTRQAVRAESFTARVGHGGQTSGLDSVQNKLYRHTSDQQGTASKARQARRSRQGIASKAHQPRYSKQGTKIKAHEPRHNKQKTQQAGHRGSLGRGLVSSCQNVSPTKKRSREERRRACRQLRRIVPTAASRGGSFALLATLIHGRSIDRSPLPPPLPSPSARYKMALSRSTAEPPPPVWTWQCPGELGRRPTVDS